MGDCQHMQDTHWLGAIRSAACACPSSSRPSMLRMRRAQSLNKHSVYGQS